MELRTQTSFLAGVIAIALTALLRLRKSRLLWWFGAFSLSVAAWHLRSIGSMATLFRSPSQ